MIGFPFAGGQPREGVNKTPHWLVTQDWYKELEKNHITSQVLKVTDENANSVTNSGTIRNCKNYKNVVESNIILRDATEQALRAKTFPIVVGGDHSQGIGSQWGLKRVYPNAKIVWIDAHIDINNGATSPSGNMHGMPMAFLSGDCEGIDKPTHNPATDVVYFGIRSFEEGEDVLVKQYKTPIIKSEECDADNIPAAIKRITDHFPIDDSSQPIWISFDIDGLDQREFESTGTPELQGLSYKFVRNLLKELVPRAVGMDLTEINFDLAPNEETKKKDMARAREIVEDIVSWVPKRN